MDKDSILFGGFVYRIDEKISVFFSDDREDESSIIDNYVRWSINNGRAWYMGRRHGTLKEIKEKYDWILL